MKENQTRGGRGKIRLTRFLFFDHWGKSPGNLEKRKIVGGEREGAIFVGGSRQAPGRSTGNIRRGDGGKGREFPFEISFEPAAYEEEGGGRKGKKNSVRWVEWSNGSTAPLRREEKRDDESTYVRKRGTKKQKQKEGPFFAKTNFQHTCFEKEGRKGKGLYTRLFGRLLYFEWGGGKTKRRPISCLIASDEREREGGEKKGKVALYISNSFIPFD